jgi:hypothetical protein
LFRTPFFDVLGSHAKPAEGLNSPERVARKISDAGVRRPFFAFSHSVVGHAPYVFRGRDCRRIHSGFAHLNNKTGEDRAAYVGGLECTETSTLRAVEQIEANDPGSVIILQADHGVHPDIDWRRDRWPKAWLDDRSSILSAIKLPRSCRKDVPADLTVVNTMRVVFGCLGRRPLPLTPPRRFVLNPALTHLREVTKRP